MTYFPMQMCTHTHLGVLYMGNMDFFCHKNFLTKKKRNLLVLLSYFLTLTFTNILCHITKLKITLTLIMKEKCSCGPWLVFPVSQTLVPPLPPKLVIVFLLLVFCIEFYVLLPWHKGFPSWFNSKVILIVTYGSWKETK